MKAAMLTADTKAKTVRTGVQPRSNHRSTPGPRILATTLRNPPAIPLAYRNPRSLGLSRYTAPGKSTPAAGRSRLHQADFGLSHFTEPHCACGVVELPPSSRGVGELTR